ncbi:hydrogenase [Beijerinckiaceae bacterium]|nr:hydrogenase [Beijerinckiaceae bacterium]
MDADEAYRWLIGCSAHSAHDSFDLHIVASVFALAMSEAEQSHGDLIAGVGLEKKALLDLVRAMFPGTLAAFQGMLPDTAIVVDEEEQSLRDILGIYATGARRLERPLAAVIARRCKSPHHLWQDLGLRNRDELSRLMKRHFARLAERNQHNMKWKKFLYRMVCGSEGFTLCAAPVCSECDDFADCFGAEDGEARLARLGNPRENAA